MKKLQFILALLVCLFGTVRHEATAGTTTFYLVDHSGWARVNARVWKSYDISDTSDVTVTRNDFRPDVNVKVGETTYTTVYSITVDSSFDRVQFSDGDSGKSTETTVSQDCMFVLTSEIDTGWGPGIRKLERYEKDAYTIIPADILSRRIYISFGTEFVSDGNPDKAPRVKPLAERQTAPVALTSDDFDGALRMSRAAVNDHTSEDAPLWYVDLTDDELASAKDLVFLFEPADFSASGNSYRQYGAGLVEGFEADKLTGFVYVGADGKAAQSYVTFGRYETACSLPVEGLCCVGSGLDGLPDGGSSGFNCLALEPADGAVYTLPLNGGDSDARITLSAFNPRTMYNGSGDMDADRARATFSLGILGCDRSHQAVVSGSIPLGAGSSASEVVCTPCRTMPATVGSTASWVVPQSFTGATSSLVIGNQDGGPLMGVTLLPFDLTPALADVKVTVRRKDLSPDEAGELASDPLKAEAVNGKVLFTSVNEFVPAATISVPADETGSVQLPDGSSMDYKFVPVYEIYSGSDLVGTCKAAGKIEVEGLAPGESSTLAVRTRYTDATVYDGNLPTGLTFRTAASGQVTLADIEIAQPEVEVVTRSYSPGSFNTLDHPDLTMRSYTLGAYAELKVTPADEPALCDAAWYADFSLAASGDSYHAAHPECANGGEVVRSSHPAATDIPGAKSVDYNPWSGESVYSDENNWSARLAAADVWPVHLPDVAEVKREYKYGNDWQFYEAEPKVTVDCTVSMVYPFLVAGNTSVKGAGSESPIAAPRRTPRADGAGSRLVVRSGGDVGLNFALNGGDLTGVRDVIAPEGGAGSAEYYDLRGMRMSGELTPGIYIRRQGTRVEKVAVR